MVSGFGAVPEGFMAARQVSLRSDLDEARAREAQLDQLAGQVAGAALFTGGFPGAMPIPGAMPPGPQPPMPGEASVPARPQLAAAAPDTPFGQRFGSFDQTTTPSGRMAAFTPSPAAGPSAGGVPTGTGGPPPAQTPSPGAAAGGGMPRGVPQLDLQTAIARVDRVQPNLPPQLKMRALERMMPIMNQQAQQQLAQLRIGFEERSLAERERHNRFLEGGGMAGTAAGQESLTRLGWTPEALDTAAATYNKTGKLPTNLGSRQFAGMITGAIMNRATQQMSESGVTPEQRANQWQEYKARQVALQRFLSGPQGNTIRSLNVVTDHLSTLQGLADALENNDVQAINRVAQMWAEQTGQTAPTNLDTAKQIVGTEVIKALGVAGAGTKDDREEAARAFDRAKSPAQLRGAISTVQKLLTGQIKGLRKQAIASGVPAETFDEMMLEETKKFMGTGEAANPAAPSVGPKPGTVQDGYRFKGGDPSKPESWEKVQ